MSSVGTLWTVSTQHKGTVVRAAIAYAGKTVEVPADYKHFEDNQKQPFLDKFPHGKIPALETPSGFKLFEAYAIARYVAATSPNSGLLGGTLEEAALVDQWCHLVESEVETNIDSVRALIRGRIQYTKPGHTFILDRQDRTLNTLNTHLATRTFFVGERITLADLFVAAVIQKACMYTLDAAERPKYPHLIRHMETVINQPKLKPVYGETTYIETAISYQPPVKEKKEEKKPQAPAAPKAEKPKPKPKDDDEEEDDIPAEPKAKNPLDDLPKSTFNLEDWKRAYSNKETRGAGGAIEWFYENFDHAGFSIWRVDFKYNSELTQTYMSSNQIGGFFNRLEASRKYLFGSVGVLGENSNSIISGVFIARGQEIEKVVDCAPDWESYEYKKLDVKGADKEFFEAALAWDLEVGGKKWADGKNFK